MNTNGTSVNFRHWYELCHSCVDYRFNCACQSSSSGDGARRDGGGGGGLGLGLGGGCGFRVLF